MVTLVFSQSDTARRRYLLKLSLFVNTENMHANLQLPSENESYETNRINSFSRRIRVE